MNKIKLIVGLGNPGQEYKMTRHNVGFLMIDSFAQEVNQKLEKNHFNSLITSFNIEDTKVILAKPQTYMNLSGTSVGAIINFYKINLKDILIIYDDISLNLGTLRLKPNGSSGGQNGMKSIISVLGSEQFARLKIGIGPKQGNLSNFVLSKFNSTDLNKIHNVEKLVHKAIELFIKETPLDKIMNLIN